MGAFKCGIRLSAAVLAQGLVFGLALPAGAQESLDRGKTPAQMFASDCAICHKTVNGLNKSSGLFGLDSFLRQHYTASRESAAAIAAYIQAMDKGAPAAPAQRTKRTAKTSDKKPVAAKPGEQKPGEAKGEIKIETKIETKTPDGKPSEPKSGEAKPVEAKVEAQPAEAKPEAKPESKPEPKAETKPSEPAAAQSAKPDKSE